MDKLNYTSYYKVKFIIEKVDISCDLLWELVRTIKFWQTKKWNKEKEILPRNSHVWTSFKFGSRILSERCNYKPVYLDSAYYKPKQNPSSEYWACRIIERRPPQLGFCEREWCIDVGFQSIDANSAEICMSVSYGDTPGFIGRYEDTPTLTLPSLVRLLLENEKIHCYIGSDDITTAAQKLEVGDFPILLEALKNPNRSIPYIYISPQKLRIEEIGEDGRESRVLINPYKLAKAVCGNARVFYSCSLAFTQEMSYMFRCPEYACYGGNIRVYRPNFDDGNLADANHHPTLYTSTIEDLGEDGTLEIFRRGLAQNLNYYEDFFDIDSCKEMQLKAQRKQRILDLHEQHKNELANLSETQLDMAIEEEQKRLEAEDALAAKTKELKSTKEQLFVAETRITQLSQLADKSSSFEQASRSRFHVKKYPSSQEDVINYFELTFPDRLIFTGDCIKSLKTCNIPAALLWDNLFALATTMCDLFNDEKCSDPYRVFLAQTGISAARGEGTMTRNDKKLMRQFITEYDGRKIDVEPHITFPNMSQSIHFGFDLITKKIIIGHCGEHKQIYSSKKYK